jgi:hypothetical protein
LRGKCCYNFVKIGGIGIHDPNAACKYLNRKSGRCRIYADRHEMCPNCLTIEEMYIVGSFPPGCPYVKNDAVYQARSNTRHLTLPSHLAGKVREQFEEYQEMGKDPLQYQTIYPHFCPRCKSVHIYFSLMVKASILHFGGKCQACGHEWSTFREQLRFTRKMLKRGKLEAKEVFL